MGEVMRISKLNEGIEKPSLFYENPSSQSCSLASRCQGEEGTLTLSLSLAFSFRFVYFIILKEEETRYLLAIESIFFYSILLFDLHLLLLLLLLSTAASARCLRDMNASAFAVWMLVQSVT